MFEITDHSPAYVHSIGGHNLPEHLRELIREDANENEYKVLDYMDGDFKYVVDLALVDPTPLCDLVKFSDGEDGYDESTYPYKNWAEDSDDMEFNIYVEWMLLVHHIRANVPAHVIATNLFAVQM